MLQQMQGGGTPTGASPASPVVGSIKLEEVQLLNLMKNRDNEYGSQYGEEIDQDH